jgi:tetratricopeptide (TPR) repeat protein
MRKHFSIAFFAGVIACASQPVLAISGSSPADDTRGRYEERLGIDLFRAGKLVESVDHLAVALNQFPDDVEILKYLSAAHRRIARTVDLTAREAEVRLANAYFERVLAIDTDERDYLQFAGETYLDMDDLAHARAKLDELGAICPQGCAQHDALAADIAVVAALPPPKEATAAGP